ncbi:MAG: high-affinity nickel-transporter, partial [Dehalococcoidia bacterium]|nr:high-affinity nickel-transporter [Dehalococcoidia bacterium]
MRRLVRSTRLWAAFALALCAFGLLPLIGGGSNASAHPLGNFTINRYTRIELSPETISLRYVLDMAEIPAFQEREEIDTDGDGALSQSEEQAYASRKAADVLEELQLSINGEQVALRPATTDLSFPPGVGGLETLRLVADYVAPAPEQRDRQPQRVEYADENYAERAGWREIVARPVAGVRIAESSVPAEDLTNELRAYPKDGIANPLNVTSASFDFSADPLAAQPAPPRSADASEGTTDRSNNRFTSLITSEELSVPFVLGAMAVAFAFGAMHALSPGHGKTVVGAYLVGERGTARHALALGLLVTATHTSSVFALALVTLYASQFVVPERLYPWLSLGSAALVLCLGSVLLASRARGVLRRRRPPTAAAEVSGGDGHDAHGHSHALPGEGPPSLSWKSLAALGISGGMLPCPSALVVLLGAISLHRVGLGLL